jgi:TnpA family transposase
VEQLEIPFIFFNVYLGQQTVLQPKEIMTDTAGYSDIMFGILGLLEYQFSPRLANIGDSTFWRTDKSTDYGQLNNLSKNKIINNNWDDILRVIGSLKLGSVNPTSLIQMLQRGGKPTMLAVPSVKLEEFIKHCISLYILMMIPTEEEFRHNLATVLV